MNFDLGFRAGFLLTMKGGRGDVLKNHFVGIKNGVITEVAPFQGSQEKACTDFIDRRDQIVMPGLINGHTHLTMSLFRGYEDDRSFQEWIFEKILPAEARLLNPEFVSAGVRLSLLECIRFGTTTVSDMYPFPAVTAHEIDQAGMRGIVAWHFADFIAPDERHLGEDAIPSRERRFREFYEAYRNHPRIRPALGPHAPYTCSDELLKMMARLATELNIPVHMHVSEPKSEVEESFQKYGKSPPQRLADLGLLKPGFLAAHCVHLSDEDIALFKKSGASIIHNPDSNAKLSAGIARITKYREAGIPVALGTDGAASNNDLSLFGAMDLATKLQKLSNQNTTAMGALDALNLATYEGAKALGMSDLVGSIEVGKRADLISLRTDLPHVKPLYSVLSQLVYAYQGLEVDTVVCDGRVLYQNDQFNTLDQRAIDEDIEKMRGLVTFSDNGC